MKNKTVQQFVETYHLYEDDAIQQIQLQHRFSLVKAFNLQPGMRILEIGCGQGDTTMALAHIVGDSGFVKAIDIASGDYGAPMTLQEAHENIKKSPLGSRIEFQLDTDFLSLDTTEQYDAIVFSHCSWYFHDEAQLLQYFEHTRSMTSQLCFAEWDTTYHTHEQSSHFFAVTILALFSQYVDNDGNIQAIFTKKHIQKLLKQANFTNCTLIEVDASYLQDGAWEQDYANSIQSEFSDAPPLIQTLLDALYDNMNTVQQPQSLNSFVIIAR